MFNILLLAALLSTAVNGQQISAAPLRFNTYNISASCFNAMNSSNLNCDPLLVTTSLDYPILDANSTTALCTSDCLTSLSKARQTVAGACNSSDVINIDNNLYPATYLADRYLFTYNISCMKDKSSGSYCNSLLSQWTMAGNLTDAQQCSYCLLGADQIQLNSPFGYDSQYAVDFASKTSSCKATNYTYTTPTTFGTTPAPGVTTSAPVAAPTCASTYTVQSGDTANAVAIAKQVSTFSVILNNNITNVTGNTPLVAGTSLCLQSPCNIYGLRPSDTCNTILAANTNITWTQLLTWNPNINNDCSNLEDYPNFQICLSSPSGSIVNPSITSDPAVSVPTTPAPKPTNAPQESNNRCGRWYTVQDGDYCQYLSVQFSISLHDFYYLNPEINANCTNLLLGIAYCIAPVGNIQTYANYSGGANFTVPPQTYLTPTSPTGVVTATTTPTPGPANQYPQAPNTTSNCYAYQDWVNSTLANVTANSCAYRATSWGVSVANITTWNPSLNKTNCTFQKGYSYCVQLTQLDPALPSSGNSGSSLCQKNSTAIISGTTNACTCFWNVPYADNGYQTCDDYAAWFNVATTDLLRWNSWLNSTNCTGSLFSGLVNSWDSKPLCCGTGTPTTTTGPTTAPTSSPTSATPGAPTQSGIISSCTRFYTTVSGDGCPSIQQKFNITFGQFLNWNPAIGSQCTNLWLNESYCVAAPGLNPAEPAAPIRAGTLPDTKCKQYYTIQSGDGCYSIDQMFNINTTQLYTWNTDIKSDCSDLELGYALCVQIK